jgi:hypothetical protein
VGKGEQSLSHTLFSVGPVSWFWMIFEVKLLVRWNIWVEGVPAGCIVLHCVCGRNILFSLSPLFKVTVKEELVPDFRLFSVISEKRELVAAVDADVVKNRHYHLLQLFINSTGKRLQVDSLIIIIRRIGKRMVSRS